MNKNTLKCVLISVLLCASQLSFAATDIVNAKIIDIAPDKGYGVIYITFSSAQRGTTECVTSPHKYQYQINDLGTPVSDALLSTALMAFAAGKTVKAVGMGSCDGRAGIETLRLITFVM